MKKLASFYIRTYGCQMNELDSEMMVGILEKRGLQKINDEMAADLIIFNTCSIRDLAERKVLGKLGRLAKSCKRRPIIGIAGCMATSKKEKLFQKVDGIDFVIGPNNIHQLGTILDEIENDRTNIIHADPNFSHELDYTLAKRDDPVKAFVSIIRGCNKHCTYCIVPYARGPEVSRHPDEIVNECVQLAETGYKEITLLGQNVDSYGKDRPEWKSRLSDLLARLDPIEGLERIRFLTSHPVDITCDLMEAVRDLPKVCEYIHFPLQSGSTRVLNKMHRMYTRDEYDEKVALFREIVPNVSLGTDMIVGFPTETEEEFEKTKEALETIRFSHAFLFTYSARKGAPAARWKDDVPKEVKESRLQELLTIQERISNEQMQALLGQSVEVLVEGLSPKDPNIVRGRTRDWRNVLFPGSQKSIGTLQKVELTSFAHQTFIAKVV